MVNSRVEATAVARTAAWAAAAMVGVVSMAACGAQGDGEKAASAPEVEQQASEQTTEPEAGASDSAAADDSSMETEDVGWAGAFAYAFVSVKGSDIEYTIDGTIIDFTYPDGAVADDSGYDCLLAVSSFGTDHPDWDLKMTYPDGSVLCSEVES